MTWINVDAAQLEAAASSLRETKSEVSGLAEYAREADPDWWMWGLGGIPFAAMYFGVSELVFHPALKDAEDAVEGLAARLEDCATEHQDNDDAIAAELEKIGGDIEKGEI